MMARTKEELLDLIRTSFAASPGMWIGRTRFLTENSLKAADIFRFFPRWSEAVSAAGIDITPYNQKIPVEELLEDWADLVRKNGRIPTRNEYKLEGSYSASVFERNFGPWSQIPDAFRAFATSSPEWADVLQVLPPEPASLPPPRLSSPSPSTRPAVARADRLADRPVYGDPIDFRGLRHAPANESGVVFLFGMVARELGFLVEAIQHGFPDCEAKRQIAPGKWQRVRIEFEFDSRHFLDHGHPIDQCDLVVCWRHNWTDPPQSIEFIELSSVLPTLGSAVE